MWSSNTMNHDIHFARTNHMHRTTQNCCWCFIMFVQFSEFIWGPMAIDTMATQRENQQNKFDRDSAELQFQSTDLNGVSKSVFHIAFLYCSRLMALEIVMLLSCFTFFNSRFLCANFIFGLLWREKKPMCLWFWFCTHNSMAHYHHHPFIDRVKLKYLFKFAAHPFYGFRDDK